MRIQNTVIVSVFGGVVQDIATDLDPDRVQFILKVTGRSLNNDTDNITAEDSFGTLNPSKLTDVFSTGRQRRLGVDNCVTDSEAHIQHKYGVSDCRSPRLWRRSVADDLREEEHGCSHASNEDHLICANCGHCRESLDDAAVCNKCRAGGA